MRGDCADIRRQKEQTTVRFWLWTGVIKRCLKDDNKRLQSNETEKLEEKNRRFKCPHESFPTFTCTDWRLSRNFAATRWITSPILLLLEFEHPRNPDERSQVHGSMGNQDRQRYSIWHNFKSWWVDAILIFVNHMTQDRNGCLDWLWWQLNAERIRYQWDYTCFEVSSTWNMNERQNNWKARKHEKLTLTTSKLSSHAQEIAVEGAR